MFSWFRGISLKANPATWETSDEELDQIHRISRTWRLAAPYWSRIALEKCLPQQWEKPPQRENPEEGPGTENMGLRTGME